MTQFAEVLDDLQIIPNPSAATSGEAQPPPQQQQTRPSNPNIISKFRNNFLPNSRQSVSRSRSSICQSFLFNDDFFSIDRSSAITKLIFNQPVLESTTGNQILLTTDESSRPLKVSSSPTTTSSYLSTRSRGGTSIADDAHV